MFALAISPLATRQSEPVIPELWNPQGQVQLVYGLHKLLSQAVFLILTETNSIAGLPGYGLSLQSRLSQISLAEINQVQNILSQATADLSRQLLSLQQGLPLDEQLGSLTLDAIQVLEPDLLVVNISIASQAGNNANYSLNLFTSNVGG